MTDRQNPLRDRRVTADPSISPTAKQREWLGALLAPTGADRVCRVVIEPAISSRYSMVVWAQYGAARDRESYTWTLSSAGTAQIW